MLVFLRDSVKYSQKIMKNVMERNMLMSATFWGSNILTPLKKMYRQCPIPGHPLQVRSTAELIEGI
jgi:hypothetical protein